MNSQDFCLYDESIFTIDVDDDDQKMSLGSGTYGNVFLGKLTTCSPPLKVAIKRMKLNPFSSGGLACTTIREVGILKELDHPNIIKLLKDVIYKDNIHIFLIFEYLETDLSKYLLNLANQKLTLSKNMIRKILKQILEGISYCHRKKVIHRDLKTSNILLSENGEIVKIADFGLSRKICLTPGKEYTPNLVTLYYRAPELLLEGIKEYSNPVDIWSIGCIFGEMCLGKILFMGDGEIDMLKKIFKVMGFPKEESWPEGFNAIKNSGLDIDKCHFGKDSENEFEKKFENLEKNEKDLLKKMLALNPKDRITAKEALKHVRNFM